MATRKVAGPGRLGSIRAAKKSVSKKGNSDVKIIPADDSITVRFLEEPPEWFGFYEYWDEEDETYRPVIDGEEPPDGARVSFRYLANAYVVDDSAVRALKMPKTVVEALIARFEKHGTVLDRDYEISRSGSGLNTTYLVTPDAPAKMNLRRFKLLDLDEILVKMMGEVEDDTDDDDDEPRGAVSRARRPNSSKPRRTYVEEDDDDDEDEEEEEEETPAPRRRIAKKTVAPKRTIRKSVPARKSLPKRKISR